MVKFEPSTQHCHETDRWFDCVSLEEHLSAQVACDRGTAEVVPTHHSLAVVEGRKQC